ncbi:toll/interleukin-1 receptor domain-containing protein [Rhodoferax sp. 4810]|uniref:Toll/interleukin-1 receptor domain-containing protein n=1 Tax=Thiospirillum jenense TaxID=1653858 RepID=A0A839HFU3_9GAMM|nr:toll/interleukin-1 receptor domain-containing protein [Thiospirillum jenense]MBB1076166.1 toll/interleukin-1 receptor domain-containing protein [Rhodoferax jenense]MBB1126048.1 toll/interleukin-1 receptor domain-containing protein [Thiospirillum jenense]
MFYGFNLTEFNCCGNHNRSQFDIQKSGIKKQLVDLFSSNSAIDAEEVANVIFPTQDCDAFLSHSSRDIKLALEIKARLESINLKVFIDSLVWDSVYELLEAIDNKHCLNQDQQTYDYKKCQASASHIYMILNSALHQMIDKSEAFMFVNTDKSLVKDSTYSVINDKDKTYSAWIHSELHFSKLVERNRPLRMQVEQGIAIESIQRALLAKALQVKHPAPLEHLIPLNESRFNGWVESARRNPQACPLDLLYDHFQPR